jgi:hypothetical protein
VIETGEKGGPSQHNPTGMLGLSGSKQAFHLRLDPSPHTMAAFRKHVADNEGYSDPNQLGITPRGHFIPPSSSESSSQPQHQSESIVKHLQNGSMLPGLVSHTKNPNSPESPMWLNSVFDTPRGNATDAEVAAPENGGMYSGGKFNYELSVDTDAAPQLPTPTITSRPESTLYRDSLHFDFSETIKDMAGSPTAEGMRAAGVGAAADSATFQQF